MTVSINLEVQYSWWSGVKVRPTPPGCSTEPGCFTHRSWAPCVYYWSTASMGRVTRLSEWKNTGKLWVMNTRWQYKSVTTQPFFSHRENWEEPVILPSLNITSVTDYWLLCFVLSGTWALRICVSSAVVRHWPISLTSARLWQQHKAWPTASGLHLGAPTQDPLLPGSVWSTHTWSMPL